MNYIYRDDKEAYEEALARLSMLADGKSLDEIANVFGILRKTLYVSLRRSLQRFGVDSWNMGLEELKVMARTVVIRERVLQRLEKQRMNKHEEAIQGMTKAWSAYADTHRQRYGSLICEDHVLGPAWVEVGRSLLTLLNGETGDIDCGSYDRAIREVIVENGGEEE